MRFRPILAAALVCLTGCAARTDFGVARWWCDWNTLGCPAVYCEKLSHEPPPPARVATFRWMYGEGPDLVCQPTVVALEPAPLGSQSAPALPGYE